MAKVGDQVLYVLPDDLSQGAIRPAVIVRVWDADEGLVNLQVFTDGSNDGEPYANGSAWATSVRPGKENEPGTWHMEKPIQTRRKAAK